MLGIMRRDIPVLLLLREQKRSVIAMLYEIVNVLCREDRLNKLCDVISNNSLLQIKVKNDLFNLLFVLVMIIYGSI